MKTLRQATQDYLALRRALGYQLRCYDTVLRDFVSFLGRQRADHITTEHVLRWATQRNDVTPRWRATQVGIVRGFARYWAARDPRTEVPPVELVLCKRRRRTPYIYTEAEIRHLIDAAEHMASRDALWPRTLSTLVGLLAATGLRIGEALSLRGEDVDLEEDVLFIRLAKFRKSRVVPLHTSTCRALKTYACERDRQRPGTPYFFVSATGRALQHGTVHTAFRRLLVQVGIPLGSPRKGPCLHDFRHRFAIQTIIRWYRAGDDVKRRLPTLSTYLGHCRPTDTYWYLSATPELMGNARVRLEQHLGELL